MLEICVMEKKEAARILYMEGVSGKDIAKMLRIRESTISTWKIDGEWALKKNNESIIKHNSAQRILGLIDYQTEALEKQVQSLRENGGTTLIERGDIDALQKLFTTIKKESRKWTDYVTVMREFLTYLQAHDLDAAQRVIDNMDRFLNEKRKVL